MKLTYWHNDNGRAFHARGHIEISEFMTALRAEVDDDDLILSQQPEHCWMRRGTDFQERQPIIIQASPGSRGAFRATWIQDA